MKIYIALFLACLIFSNNLKAQELQNLKIQEKLNNLAPVMIKAVEEATPLEFIENIRECKISEFEYTHPLTQDRVKKIISGHQEDTCLFTETMPDGLSLNCKFPLNTLHVISDEYKHAREEVLKGNLSAGNNPDSVLQQMMNDENICVIESLSDSASESSDS